MVLIGRLLVSVWYFEVPVLSLPKPAVSKFTARLPLIESPADLRRLDIACYGRLIRFRLVANAFLHHMVRNLVGALAPMAVAVEAM